MMLANLRKYFLSGLVVFLPLALTIYLFVWALTFADGMLGKYIRPYFEARMGFYVDGLGILIGIWLIMIIGFFATNFFGRKIHVFFESLLFKLPFFRQVYPAIKEMALFLFSRDKLTFKQVVLVEYPRKGIYSFGFLTNEHNPRISKMLECEVCNVFIPSAPGPLTGFIILVPRADLISTDVSVEEAIKFNVSGGVVNPVSYNQA